MNFDVAFGICGTTRNNKKREKSKKMEESVNANILVLKIGVGNFVFISLSGRRGVKLFMIYM